MTGAIEANEEECKHGLDKRWCATCKEALLPKPRWENTGFKMQARFDGPCRAERCHQWIEEGDTIVQQADRNRLIEETRFVCKEHE